MSTVSIFIISSEHEPLRLQANDTWAILPIGEDVELDERLMPLLRDTPGVKWRYTGEAAADADGRHEGPGEGFDALAIIEGNVEAVTARLTGLTSEQLISVRAAEEGRDGATRQGVVKAINKAIDAMNEDAPHAD